MNTLQRGTINLLKSTITGQVYSLPEDFNLEEAYPKLSAHQMDTLLFEGAVRCGISKELPIMRKLMQKYCAILLKSEGQIRELKRITAAFEENEIDYMLLKGSKMKALYPKHELRNMSDADVLIRIEQYDRIEQVVKSLGFSWDHASNHELVWRTKELYLELHKRLIPSYSKDLYAYFGDGWKLAVPAEGHSFTMEPEDEFVYLFTHFTKHFRYAGIGCRHVVDLWVYLRANPTIDMVRVAAELEKMHLLEFFHSIKNLLDVWFEDKETNSKVDFMTDFIFSSGSYGTMDKHALSVAIQNSGATSSNKGKISYFLTKLFPPVVALEDKYTILRKAPWLLPVVWIYRPFYKLLWERKDVILRKKELQSITTEKLTEHKAFLNYIGLDYHF